MNARPSLAALFSSLVLAQAAWSTGTIDRLRGVSQHARERAGALPEHVWVGAGLALFVLALIAGAAYWTFFKRKA